jgi:hypothetical protein
MLTMKQVDQARVFAWRFTREGEFVFDPSARATSWHRLPDREGAQSFEPADPQKIPEEGWERLRGCACKFCSEGRPVMSFSKELEREDR